VLLIVPFGLLVWSTGLSPNPLISSLKNVEKDPRSHSFVPLSSFILLRRWPPPSLSQYVHPLTSVLRPSPLPFPRPPSSLYTNDTLRIIDSTTGKALKDVFAIGDNSVVKNGPRLPATAQVATQKAIALAENLNALAAGKPETPFGLKNKGSMVYLGQWRGLLDRSADDVEGVKGTVKGLGAWFMWRSA
jgi:NADH dehydrogenase FAD-containing subunit